ncbi:MAG: hypothetical protein LBJ58_00185 [Tannerellaceae bacterium]|jgi:hypothetical protein|nr:hypothetical protein [Tannerellaceae bacterium]
MNKNALFGVLFALLFPFVTSCLREGGQKVLMGNYPGVAVKRNDSVKIHLKGNDVVYSPQVNSSIDDGDCVIIDFSLDFGTPENSDSGRLKGFLTVDISNVEYVPGHDLRSELTDTATILPGEHAVAAIQQRNIFILNRFFLFTEHSADTLPLRFELSYDPYRAVTDKVYDLFLRVTKISESAAAPQPKTQYNAFNLTDLANRTTDSIVFRINYARGFSRDSTQINWAVTPTYSFAL